MGLLDDIQTETAKRQRPGIDGVLEQLPLEEHDELLAALANPQVPVRAILRVLQKRNVTVTEDRLRGYRRRMVDGAR